MAYTLYYTANFVNEQSQSVAINIYKKDAPEPETVENYEVVECAVTDNSEGQTKYECIIARELLLTLRTTDDDSLTWETFISSTHDEWKIEVLVDDQYYFQGFITPDEGNAPFLDKPYDVTFRATNGLALLKGISLVDINGDQFDSDHALIEYIAGALKQTGLDLPIRIYCGYFHASMQNKGNSLNNDMFQQAKVNYRTFQQTATTFVSCYEALKIILNKFCSLEYWNGMWVIASIAEKQYIPYDRFYVDYDSDGLNPSGAVDTNNYGQIGKQMEIYPIHETQLIYSRFAVKSVKTQYNYEVWPEIPKNNKFERGTLIDSGTNEDGTTWKTFSIEDWEQGRIDYFDLPNPAMTPIAQKFYRKSTYSIFGIEISREIIGETEPTDDGDHAFWLRSEGIPVNKGCKIRFSLDKKFDNNFGDSGSSVFTTPAVIYLVVGENAYYLDNNAGGGNIVSKAAWRQAVNLGGQLILMYLPDSDTREYSSLSIESDPLPFDGTLYISLNVNGPIANTGTNQYYKNINFEYLPFIAAGYVQVEGDYWLRSQAANFPDVVEDEVFISDSPHRVVKGALLFNNQLTDGAWYRFGYVGNTNPLGESRHFKELLNLARLNHSYRRMYALEGDFNGLNYAPENNTVLKQPIGFFWMYREADMTTPRDFVFVPPLTMDICRGWIKANLVEVKKDSNDGTQEGEAEFKYVF